MFHFQVSWIRHSDTSLLTVGRYTYTTDLRFESFHSPHTEDWILQLRNPKPTDSGVYECQISTTPHLTHKIFLTVHGKAWNKLGVFIKQHCKIMPLIDRILSMRSNEITKWDYFFLFSLRFYVKKQNSKVCILFYHTSTWVLSIALHNIGIERKHLFWNYDK